MGRFKKDRVIKGVVADNAYNNRMRHQYLENYVVNRLKAEFYVARCNMLAEQLDSGIVELVDGCKKSREYVVAEYFLSKHSAVQCMAQLKVSEVELLKLGTSIEQVKEYFNNYLKLPIVRDDYGAVAGDSGVARFVDE